MCLSVRNTIQVLSNCCYLASARSKRTRLSMIMQRFTSLRADHQARGAFQMRRSSIDQLVQAPPAAGVASASYAKGDAYLSKSAHSGSAVLGTRARLAGQSTTSTRHTPPAQHPQTQWRVTHPPLLCAAESQGRFGSQLAWPPFNAAAPKYHHIAHVTRRTVHHRPFAQVL